MDVRRVAKRRLPGPVFDYPDAGADDELTLQRNTAAFSKYGLLPSRLTDVSRIDLQSTLFGQPIDWFVMISPTRAPKLFHQDGEPVVARAAAEFGML